MRTTTHGLREQLTRMMEERDVPGLQAVVLRDGEVVASETLGLANLEHDVPVTQESVFSINSMAKAFTGVALMQLVEAGDLDLDAPVSRYLDALPEAWQPITIRQLATLTSGLPEIMAYGADSSVGLVAADEDAAWAVVHAAPMEFEPGRGYNYVQTNYALLGKVIDRLSGKPFVDFIAERQFDVAGMIHTRYANDHDLIRHRADTYMSINAEGEPTGSIDKSRLDWPHLLRTAAGLHMLRRRPGRVDVRARERRVLSAGESRQLWVPCPALTAVRACGASGGSSLSVRRVWYRPAGRWREGPDRSLSGQADAHRRHQPAWRVRSTWQSPTASRSTSHLWTTSFRTARAEAPEG